MHASHLFIVFVLLFRVHTCLFYATRNNKTGGNQSSALGVYMLSRGLHLCILALQISCAIVHEETVRSIA